MAEFAVRPRRAVFAACTLVLAAAAGVSSPAAARTGDAAAADPIHAWLYTDRMTWHTAPGTHVTAQMFDRRSGTATEEADADANGDVTFAFGASPHDRVVSGANPALIEPLDDVTLLVDGETVVDVSVPFLTADVSIAPARVFGTAPGGATVAIALAGPDRPPFAATATADLRGAFTLDLAGRYELRYGDVGTVTVTDAAGNTFTVLIAPLAVEVTLGASRFVVQASTSPVLDAWAAPAGFRGTPGDDFALWLTDEPFETGRTAFNALDADAAAVALRAGSLITVTQDGPPPAAKRQHRITVPDIAISPDATRTALVGRAPAGAAVHIAVERADGTTWRTDAVAGADGVVRVELTDGPLDPASSTELRYDDGQGNTFVARFMYSQVVLRPTEAKFDGRTEALRTVTLTLQSRAIPVLWTFSTRSLENGTFHISFLPGYPAFSGPCEDAPWCLKNVHLAAGDVVTATFDARGPQRVEIPTLTTRTDPDNETIGGHAPPGATVSIFDGNPWPAFVEGPNGTSTTGATRWAQLRADAAGRYEGSFGPDFDIEPPRSGYAVVDAGGGVQVAEAWAPPLLQMYASTASLSVNLLPLTVEPFTATLLDDAGRELGRDLSDTGLAWPVDRLGQGTSVRDGDVLTVARSDDEVSVAIPRLDGRIDPETDVVTGHGPAGSTVKLAIDGRGPVGVVVAADGTYRYDARADGMDLRYRDTVEVSVGLGPAARHLFRTYLPSPVPGLALLLPAARLWASLDGADDAVVEVIRGGRALLRQAVRRPPANPWFSLRLGAPGPPPALAPGDIVAVRAGAPSGDTSVQLEVPVLTIEADATTNRVTGLGPPNASLDVDFGHAFLPAYGQPPVTGWNTATVTTDGMWSVPLRDYADRAGDVRPGTWVNALVRLRDGNDVAQRLNIPLLSSEVDGRRVCGLAAPFAPVHIEALDAAGTPTLSGDGTAGEDGVFAFTLADSAGRGTLLSPGTRVVGRLGAANAALTVPPLAATADFAAESISVSTVPEGEITIDRSARGCLGRVVHGNVGLWWPQSYDHADVAGAYSRTLAAADIASGIVVATYTADGMRAFRDLGGPIAAIRSGSAHVVVTATVRTSLIARLTDAAGTLRASASATANDDGRADVRLVDADGRDVGPAGGDTLTLVDDDGEGAAVPIAIEPLDVELGHGEAGRTTAIRGAAAPGRAVTLRLTLADGRRIDLDRVADWAGSFGILPADMPPRGTWRLADVVGARAVVALAGGHRLIDEEMGRRAWLPIGFAGE